MGRIENAYETKFRTVLSRIGVRRPDDAVTWLLGKAHSDARQTGATEGRALEHIYRRLAAKVDRFKLRRSPAAVDSLGTPSPVFVCDAGLGKLARWLRAAGYEAHWTASIDDHELIQAAVRLSAILLTTDSIMMERRVLRDRIVPSVWVSPSLKVAEQLSHVLAELKLPLRESRCMACGGELTNVPRESVADRIPPRTLRWLENYFQCAKCGKLFWHGTHWERIRLQLDAK